MEVKFKLSKYDILGLASMSGISELDIEKINKYINENESLELNLSDEDSERCAKFKIVLASFTILQISKTIGLKLWK